MTMMGLMHNKQSLLMILAGSFLSEKKKRLIMTAMKEQV
jgi:hypothetical protein